MPLDKVQFQTGMSMSKFTERYCSENLCASVIEQIRWLESIRYLKFAGSKCYLISVTATYGRLLQRVSSRNRAPLTTSMVLDDSTMPLRT